MLRPYLEQDGQHASIGLHHVDYALLHMSAFSGMEDSNGS
jgi:hypothetical protein